ncbi:flagellar biosynthesis protein FlgK [Glaciecola sp. XM2]|uniref:FlgK family flagellar hook-associated protein n=1 Tax=Glaciecola sp. XM2 TaxID=1914931 RepID=UPI001BDDCCB3|nr:flagellar basal body rod C-terminal domain-containing protein [Glaciecola sp. XM2]MBT1450802.1 flagellar biosynthesis protein FlgK [Glaciecola sp. XM2]
MIRNADLFTLAKSGINASNRLLNTTSNNIANVNSEGYVRESTTFTSRLNGGVDFGFTDRVFDVFAQNQLRRDTSLVGEAQAFYGAVEGLDRVLASEANSISQSMTRFFGSIQTAADDPTSMPARDAIMGEASAMLNRVTQLGDFIKAKEDEAELQIEQSVARANSLINQIGDLNEAIAVASGSSVVDTPSKLLNQRDQAILDLAEIVSLEVRNSPNGDSGLTVNLTTGESLVMADGTFNVFAVSGEPDFTNRQLTLQTQFNSPTKNESSINILEENIGGGLGGLFKYREEVLEPAQRSLGKLSIALADAVNTQNRQGMDYDGQFGGDIFNIPEFRAINYPQNSDLSLGVKGRITPGAGADVTNNDYRVTILTPPSGTPPRYDVEIAALQNDGRPQLDTDGVPITQTITVTAGQGVYNAAMGGVEIEFAQGASYQAGDSFLLQPARVGAVNLSLATTRAEDWAFASPIRINRSIDNLGDAQVIATRATNTEVAPGTLNASAFDGNGGFQDVATSPSSVFGAPVTVRFTSDTSYEVLDNSSPANVITTVSGVTDLNNLIEQAKTSGSPAWPADFAALTDYPGYDLSLQGIPSPGDVFTVEFNTNGFNDNSNAVALGELQQMDFVRQSNAGNTNRSTFNEAYSSLVGFVGSATARADVNLEAAKVMQVQSSEWFESTAGVSLDEEAANLIQFQQSYAAAAQILSSAQEMFNTILAVAR